MENLFSNITCYLSNMEKKLIKNSDKVSKKKKKKKPLGEIQQLLVSRFEASVM